MISILNSYLNFVAQTAYGDYPYGGEVINYSGVCINDACSVTTSPLASTGFTVWFAVTLASVLIFSALIVRFWKKSEKKRDK